MPRTHELAKSIMLADMAIKFAREFVSLVADHETSVKAVVAAWDEIREDRTDNHKSKKTN